MSKLTTQLDKKLIPNTTHKQSVLIRRNRFFFILVTVAIIGFGMLATFVKLNPPFFPIDLRITKFVQSFDPMWFDSLMKIITLLGNIIPSIILVSVTTVLLYVHKRVHEAALLIFSTVGITIVGLLFKQFIGRVRPDATIINQVATFTRDDSFPSGHVLFYVGFFGFLLFLCHVLAKQSKLKNIYISVLSLLLLLIGVSRIYLGAHWFSDVVGAYLLGFVWLAFIMYIYRKFELPKLWVK